MSYLDWPRHSLGRKLIRKVQHRGSDRLRTGRRGSLMSCEHLICAQCAGPVVEGRCPACRAAKTEVHHSRSPYSVPLLLMVLIAALLVMLALHLH